MHARQLAIARPATFAPRQRNRDATLRRWRTLESAVARIVGQRGASALMQHTAVRADARLAALGEHVTRGDCRDTAERLHELLAGLSEDAAAELDAALHSEFSALLTRLLGRTIALRLLEGGPADPAATARIAQLRPNAARTSA